MENVKYRIRKKGSKYILQRSEGNKWQSRTLKPGIALWNLLCPGIRPLNVSSAPKRLKKNKDKKFSYELLSEPQSSKESRTQKAEATNKKLYEMTK